MTAIPACHSPSPRIRANITHRSPKDAKKQQGQNELPKPSRQQLLLEFDLQKESLARGHTVREYFIGDPYPPSTKHVAELSPIHFSELKRDTHHHGMVVFVRVIEDEMYVTALQTIVEDEKGAAERLALYNVPVASKTEGLLPNESLLAIKEPFYESTKDGYSYLRVDHPSDIIFLSERDPILPALMRPSDAPKSVSDWKQKGNDAYKAGKHAAASRAYGQAIQLCTEDDSSMRRDLLRNRAIVNIYLKRYESAVRDAKGAIIPESPDQEEKTLSLNAKACHRAGRAAYELAHFQDAETYFKDEHALEPNDKDASRSLELSRDRLSEESAGNYDFDRMSNSASKRHNRLDHASFLANTKVGEAEDRGRGLFATAEIAAGELILCEKAFSVASDSDGPSSKSRTILNNRTEKQSRGTQAALLFNTVRYLQYDSKKAAQYFDLYDGGYPSKTPLDPIDGVVPVDVFRTLGIIECNAIGCPSVRTGDPEDQKQASSSTGYASTGLWLNTAYVNHACNANAMRSFIGDMIILRATRDVEVGEEILMPYRLPHVDNKVTQNELKRVWGFKCECSLCIAEAVTPFRQRKERLRLAEEIDALVKVRPVTIQKQSLSKNVAQVERLFMRLVKTYDEKQFTGIPRLGLIATGLWLCEAYHLKSSWDKLQKAAVSLLRDHGYIVSIAEAEVGITQEHCYLVDTAVEAALFVAQALTKTGKSSEGEKMLSFARTLYQSLNGETRDFDKSHERMQSGRSDKS